MILILPYLIGFAICWSWGAKKHHGIFGFLFGLCLGPIGLIFVWCLPSAKERSPEEQLQRDRKAYVKYQTSVEKQRLAKIARRDRFRDKHPERAFAYRAKLDEYAKAEAAGTATDAQLAWLAASRTAGVKAD